MADKETVLFVPGYQEGLDDRDYQGLMASIEDQGYKAQFVPIKWRRTTVQDWVRELNAIYDDLDAEETVLAGFSFGALTAFVAAAARNPSQLWLCSLSPYFAEEVTADRGRIKRRLGRRRTQAFMALDFASLAQKISCETLLFYGEKEIPSVIRRVSAASQAVAKSHTVAVSDCGHDATDPRYVAALRKTI